MARSLLSIDLARTLRWIALASLLAMFVSLPASAQFPRRVVIEEFTSATCTPCVQATPVLNDIENTYQGNVVIVRYHVNLPVAGDPWYVSTFVDPRKTLYGVSGSNGPPKAFVDGQYAVAPTDKAAVKDLVDQELATDAQSPVKIDVTQTIQGGNLNIHVVITAGPNGLPDTYKLRVIPTEAHIHVDNLNIAAYNHETEFYDVPRLVMPNNNGVDVTLAANATQSFDYVAPIGSTWQADQMYAVAILQSDFAPYEVVQAGNTPRPAASRVDYESAPLAGYSLLQSTPNPASSSATIGYTLGKAEQVTIALHNSVGDQVATLDEGMVEPGEHRALVDLSALPAGAYTYTIRAGSWSATRMLSVVR